MKTTFLYKKRFFLSVIFLSIAVFTLSFYKLGSLPNGFYVDEAVSGYNSYSLLKTGRDEYGKTWPIALRFFGSYTPPLYAYVSIIPIQLFGLTEFSTRFIGALSGVFSVFISYLFIRELKLLSGYKLLFGLMLFALSPWVVFYSRVGYEVYFATLLFMTGEYFCLKSLTRAHYLFTAFLFLLLSTYAAHPQKYLILIWIPCFLLVFRSQLQFKKNKKILFASLLLVLIMSTPYMYLLSTQAFLTKNSLFYTTEIMNRAHASSLPLVISIPLSAAYEFFARYVVYLSPKSLFFMGDPDLQRSIPELSVFYTWMIVPYLVGIFALFKRVTDVKYKFMLLLVTISPIPAALTHDPFSTQRALSVFFSLFLVVILGVSQIFDRKVKLLSALMILFGLVYSPLMLWRSYFVLFSVERAQVWGYGYKQLIQQITSNENTVYVIDQTRMKPVYIEYAFYAQYSPEKMQQLYSQEFVSNYYNEVTFTTPAKIENVEFRPIVWREDICKPQILVGDYLTFSETTIKEHFLSHVFTILSPKNEVLFVGYKTHPELKCQNTELTETNK